MEKRITQNAKIAGTAITMADHGCITFWLYLEGDGWGCGFGGYCIGNGYLGAKNFSGHGSGLEAMARIMNTVGVDKWEDLNGKMVRAITNGFGGTIDEIGNIIEDKWFNIKEFFAEKKRNEEG